MTEIKEYKTIFEYDHYKAYLKDTIQRMPKRGRGFRSQLAQSLRCQTAYISQVLNGDAQFTLEQALGVNALLGHGEDEAHFFLLLVQLERAGLADLKNYFQKQISDARSKRTLIRERFKSRAELSTEDRMVYYSEWYYGALHILSSIPALQSRQAMQQALGLPASTLNRALQFLTSCGLIRADGGRLKIGETRIHLGSDSPLISKHHINWRLQAMRSLERSPEQDLHYSSIVSISAQDVEKIKGMLVDMMDRYNKAVASSPEEECHCLALDFFKVTGK